MTKTLKEILRKREGKFERKTRTSERIQVYWILILVHFCQHILKPALSIVIHRSAVYFGCHAQLHRARRNNRRKCTRHARTLALQQARVQPCHKFIRFFNFRSLVCQRIADFRQKLGRFGPVYQLPENFRK